MNFICKPIWVDFSLICPEEAARNDSLRALQVVSKATGRSSQETWRQRGQAFERYGDYLCQAGSFLTLVLRAAKLDPNATNPEYVGRSDNRTVRCNEAVILAGHLN